MLHVPRFFAALRMTSGRRKGKLVTSAAKRLITRMPIKPYDTEKANPVTPLASPLGEEGHEVAKGVQANWIHRGAPRPANPVRRHPAKSVWTRVRMIMTLDVDVTAERRHYNTHRPLKGKRLTTFCASLALLHPLLSLTHWIFGSLMLPYKSSSHSASTAVTDSLDFRVADAPLQIQFA